MEQDNLIEQRKRELQLKEKEEILLNAKNQKRKDKIGEFWDCLVKTNSNLDPIIRLSSEIKTLSYEDKKVHTLGPLIKFDDSIKINSWSIVLSFSTGLVIVDKNKGGIFDTDTISYLPIAGEYYNDTNGESFPLLSIFYDFEKKSLILRIVKGNWCDLAGGLKFQNFEIQEKDVDVLLKNIISGNHLSEGLKSKENESKCFIATAVYGTPYAYEVTVLKEFRDNFLVNYLIGRVFVSLYYKTSPPIANLISKHNFLKRIIKVTFIIPLLKFIKRSKERDNPPAL